MKKQQIFYALGVTAVAFAVGVAVSTERMNIELPSVVTVKTQTQAQSQNVKNAEQVDVYLAPHKALYEMKLDNIHSGSAVTGLGGEMFFEWHDTCDAWTTDHRFKIHYQYANRPSLTTASEYTSWEAKTGEAFHFISTSKANGEIVEKIKGMAMRNEDQAGDVTYDLPENMMQELPVGYYLPSAHTEEMIRHALAGERFFSATLFDGTDTQGAVEVNTVIGDAVKPEEIKTQDFPDEVAQDLLNGRAWHMRLAFFSMEKKDELPSYEMSLVLHENGIVSSLLIEYRDFSVKQRLKALEELTAPKC